jgi:hypothetical protein
MADLLAYPSGAQSADRASKHPGRISSESTGTSDLPRQHPYRCATARAAGTGLPYNMTNVNFYHVALRLKGQE